MNPPRLLAVSDLSTLSVPLENWLADLVAVGVDALWLRERALGDRDLLDLALRCRRFLPVLLSSRVDLALLAEVDGVHLPAAGLPTAAVRRLAERHGRPMLLGRSTHHVAEVQAAQSEGLDYVTFGPVFPTPTKTQFGPPLGLEELARAVATGIPVIALGGIDATGAARLRPLGIAGVAALRIFQSTAAAHDLARAFLR